MPYRPIDLSEETHKNKHMYTHMQSNVTGMQAIN